MGVEGMPAGVFAEDHTVLAEPAGFGWCCDATGSRDSNLCILAAASAVNMRRDSLKTLLVFINGIK